MKQKKAPTAHEQEAHWNERDELQRLDFVAGVVAPTALAGCVAAAALIATGQLEPAASYCLGGAGLVLLASAVLSALSLAWSPLQTVQAGKGLDRVIATKRWRTNWALAGLALSVIIGFGATAVIEGAHADSGQEGRERGARPGAAKLK